MNKTFCSGNCKIYDLIKFKIKEITVIGPTPPGTGVIYDAFSLKLKKSKSPEILLLLRCIPTSTSTTPSLTFEGKIGFMHPVATITTFELSMPSYGVNLSYFLTTLLKFDKYFDKGLPTIFDCPIIDISLFL